MQQRQPRPADNTAALRDGVVDFSDLRVPGLLSYVIVAMRAILFSVSDLIDKFLFQPLRHDADHFVVRLTLLPAHVAGAGDDAQILRAAMLGQQDKDR